MTDDHSTWPLAREPRAVPAWVGALLEKRLRKLVASLEYGHLTIVTPEGKRIERVGSQPGPAGILRLHNWRAIRRLIRKGDVGFAEGYIAGDWTTPDLRGLLEFAMENRVDATLDLKGWLPLRLADRLLHRLRKNSRAGSRKNIPAHYDLGNAFYAAWLDAGMTYSSALYDWDGQTLEEAQTAKQDLAIRELNLSGSERVLEIGCGWGGLAERMAALGCHVTAITLSPAQLDYTRRRIEKAGLADRVDVRLQDYRDVQGSFDRIVSIEMIEAVGEAYWTSYFGVLRDRLVAGGRAVIQAITIADDRFDRYRRRVDFIQRYVFPGGMLLSPTALRGGLNEAGLKPAATATFGQSYATTLLEWNRRFQHAWPELAHTGLAERFRRVWEYYLAYCSVGFRSGAIDVGIYTAIRD